MAKQAYNSNTRVTLPYEVGVLDKAADRTPPPHVLSIMTAAVPEKAKLSLLGQQTVASPSSP